LRLASGQAARAGGRARGQSTGARRTAPAEAAATSERLDQVDRNDPRCADACVESQRIGRWTLTGDAFIGALAIDRAIKRFMVEHDIRAASAAIARDGAVIGSRGYTWALPDYPITRPATLFRVASVSKIFTCAAIDQLVRTGVLGLDTPAFPYLGVTKLPLIPVDRDMNSITVKHLATRQSGLKDDVEVEVEIRSIAKLFGTTSRPTLAQVLQYIFGTALVARPGTGANYPIQPSRSWRRWWRRRRV